VRKPTSVKGYFGLLIELADTHVAELKGSRKLSDNEEQQLQTCISELQNQLGEANDILKKFNLEWKG